MDPVEYRSQGGAYHPAAGIEDGDVHIAQRLTISSRPAMMHTPQRAHQAILSSPPPPPPTGALPTPPATLPRQQYQPRKQASQSRPRPRQQPRIITDGTFVDDLAVGGNITGEMTMRSPGSRNYNHDRFERSAWHSPEQDSPNGFNGRARGGSNGNGMGPEHIQRHDQSGRNAGNQVQQWDDLQRLSAMQPGGNAFAIGYGQGNMTGGHPEQHDHYDDQRIGSPRSAGTQGSMEMVERHFRATPEARQVLSARPSEAFNASMGRSMGNRGPPQRPRKASDSISPTSPDSYRGARRPQFPPSSHQPSGRGDLHDGEAMSNGYTATPKSRPRRRPSDREEGYSPTYDILYTAQREYERNREAESPVDPRSRQRAGSARRVPRGPLQQGEFATPNKRAPQGARERSNGRPRNTEAEQNETPSAGSFLERPGPLVSEDSFAEKSSPTIAAAVDVREDNIPTSPEKIDSPLDMQNQPEILKALSFKRKAKVIKVQQPRQRIPDVSVAEANDIVTPLPRSNSVVRQMERPLSISASIISKVDEETAPKEPPSTRASTSTLAPPVEKRASGRFSLLKRLSGMNTIRSSSTASSSHRGTLGRTSTHSSTAISPFDTPDASPLDTAPLPAPIAITHQDTEVRASLTSLPDLIARAGRLASNLDRGRTASRLGMVDWLSAAPDVSRTTSAQDDPTDRSLQAHSEISSQSAAGTSDIIASFPPPNHTSAAAIGPGALAARGRAPSSSLTLTPSMSFFRNDLLPRRPGTNHIPRGSFILGSSEALPGMIGPHGMKSEGPFSGFDAESLRQKSMKRRVCGMELKWFIILMVVLGLLIAAAVVVPVVFVLLPKGHTQQKS